MGVFFGRSCRRSETASNQFICCAKARMRSDCAEGSESPTAQSRARSSTSTYHSARFIFSSALTVAFRLITHGQEIPTNPWDLLSRVCGSTPSWSRRSPGEGSSQHVVQLISRPSDRPDDFAESHSHARKNSVKRIFGLVTSYPRPCFSLSLRLESLALVRGIGIPSCFYGFVTPGVYHERQNQPLASNIRILAFMKDPAVRIRRQHR